ncbi:MAG: endonuclease [Parcubacteria group bacterium Gr01-1014_3]|nr:MAG: endonuclease [Parcubacteria group bacterium Gr01-1014_3]
MNSKANTGNLGEDLACRYLINNGYKILDRNFRKPCGEIDIIAKDNDATIVFVEVKALRRASSLSPEDNMSSSKIAKINRTASLWAGSNDASINQEKGFRVDLVAVELANWQDPIIRHYKNV